MRHYRIFLGFGAPIGWLLIKIYLGVDWRQEVLINIGLYSYMLFGTTFVFALFGGYAGYQEEELEYLSISDSLTTLYNRRYFYSRLKEEFYKSKRNHESISIISFDLDHFKSINDNHGHAAGDLILAEVGKVSKKTLREGEILARIGGEEFALILPDCKIKLAKNIAERLRKDIEEIAIPISTLGSLKTTASFGISELTDNMSEADLMKFSDLALYEAKEKGRNCIVVH